MKLSDLKVGDRVITDLGFDCIRPGRYLVESHKGGLFIRCDRGRHFLDGQMDKNGDLIGLSPAGDSHD